MSIRTAITPPSLPASPANSAARPDPSTSARRREGMTMLHQGGGPNPAATAARLAASTRALAHGQAAASDSLASKQLSPEGTVRDSGSMALRGRADRPTLPAKFVEVSTTKSAQGTAPTAPQAAATSASTATSARPAAAPLKREATSAAATPRPQTVAQKERAEMKNLLFEMRKIFDRKADKETGTQLSAQVFFKRGSDGQVLLYKVENENDTSKARERYLKSSNGIAARQMAAKKLESLISKAGIEVSDDLRKALPSKDNLGNTEVIFDFLSDAALKLDQDITNESLKLPAVKAEVMKEFEGELRAMNWSDPKQIGTLFRENSVSSKKLAGYLDGSFANQVNNTSKTIIDTVQSALANHKGLDQALLDGHKAMLQSLAQVHFTPDFMETAFALADLTDKIAQEQANGNNSATALKMAADIKGILPATLLLRVFCPDLTHALNLADRTIARKVVEAGGKAPKEGETLVKMADKLQKLINGQMASKKMESQIAELQKSVPLYAAFLGDQQQNSLAPFVSLNQLTEELRNGNSA